MQSCFGVLSAGLKSGPGESGEGSVGAGKSHDFYSESLEELQSKLKSLDSRFLMISLVLSNRSILEDEPAKDILVQMTNRNKEVSDEDLRVSFEEKSTAEVLRFLEESFNEKQKTFRLKKQFMENIRRMKEAQQNELSKLFNRLNQVEDEYLVTERFLGNIQTAIRQNTDEVKEVRMRIEFVNESKLKLEIESQKLEEELQGLKNQLGEQTEDINVIERKNKEYQTQLTGRLTEAEKLQSRLISDQLGLFEQKEKMDYLDRVMGEMSREVSGLDKLKAKKETEVETRMTILKETLKNKSKNEEELKKIETILRRIESGENSKTCFCELNEETRNLCFEIVYKAEGAISTRQSYSFYEHMVLDFIFEKDVS